ncbi:hypothetical protein [Paenibacillus chitinolyticus]
MAGTFQLVPFLYRQTHEGDVRAETAEYWEAGNRMKLVKNMFKKLTGKENDESDLNKTVELD